MKKIRNILYIIVLIVLVSGCSNQNKSSIDMSKYKTDGFYSISCKRNAVTDDGSKVDISIKVYYNDDKDIEILSSKEIVKSENADTLKTYKDAYTKVYKAYDNLEYYDNEIIEEKNKLTVSTYINYGKIDMKKLMEIEGEEDNVKVTDGKIKVGDWKAFAKKYGTTCE